MGDEKKPASKLRLYGCGCGFLMWLLSLIISFVLGAKYGVETVEILSQKSSAIWSIVSGGAQEAYPVATEKAGQLSDDIDKYPIKQR
jgi:hypothetical protein